METRTPPEKHPQPRNAEHSSMCVEEHLAPPTKACTTKLAAERSAGSRKIGCAVAHPARADPIGHPAHCLGCPPPATLAAFSTGHEKKHTTKSVMNEERTNQHEHSLAVPRIIAHSLAVARVIPFSLTVARVTTLAVLLLHL